MRHCSKRGDINPLFTRDKTVFVISGQEPPTGANKWDTKSLEARRRCEREVRRGGLNVDIHVDATDGEKEGTRGGVRFTSCLLGV